MPTGPTSCKMVLQPSRKASHSSPSEVAGLSDAEAAAWMALDCAEVSWLFQGAGVPHFFFKGQFRDEALGLGADKRPVDIDVWVPRPAMRRAVRALTGRGYIDSSRGWRLSEVGHSRTLQRGGGPELDLHFTFPGVFTADHGWSALAAHVVPCEQAHRCLPTLNVVGHLCLLLLNAGRPGERGLGQNRYAPVLAGADLETVRRLAADLGATAAFEAGLGSWRTGWPVLHTVEPHQSIGPVDKLRLARSRPRGERWLTYLDEVVPSRQFMRERAGRPSAAALAGAYVRRWASLPGLALQSVRPYDPG